MLDFLWFEENKCKYFQFQLKAYSEGIVEKLLKSFETTEEEVEKERQRLFENVDFDPEYDDPGNIAEAIEDKVIDQYTNLMDVRDLLFGFALTGLYHLWEKQIIDFLKTEIRHLNLETKIESWNNIKTKLSEYGVCFEDNPCFEDLNEFRLVANVVKHGEGNSKSELKQINPDLFDLLSISSQSFKIDPPMLGGGLFIKLDDFKRYEKAAVGFWNFDYWKKQGGRFPRKPK